MFGDVREDALLVVENARPVGRLLSDRPLAASRQAIQDCTELTAIIASWWSEFLGSYSREEPFFCVQNMLFK